MNVIGDPLLTAGEADLDTSGGEAPIDNTLPPAPIPNQSLQTQPPAPAEVNPTTVQTNTQPANTTPVSATTNWFQTPAIGPLSNGDVAIGGVALLLAIAGFTYAATR